MYSDIFLYALDNAAHLARWAFVIGKPWFSIWARNLFNSLVNSPKDILLKSILTPFDLNIPSGLAPSGTCNIGKRIADVNSLGEKKLDLADTRHEHVKRF